MMKPHFKTFNSAINVIHAPWFDTCIEVMNYVMPTCAISGL